MKVHLQVHLDIEGIKLSRSGSFTIRNEEDIPMIAYEWIRQIKRETGYRDTRIEKVIYDGEHDITEIVKQIKPVVKDDLPF